jgi:hypothetical protein
MHADSLRAVVTMSENPFAGQGAVMLDIGGDVGALLVVMPAAMDGVEIEARAVGGSARSHSHHHGDAGGYQHRHDSRHQNGQSHEHNHDHEHHPHVAVVARPSPVGIVHSLVFPELIAGSYELYRKPDGPVELVVSIRGGEVTQETWPEG